MDDLKHGQNRRPPANDPISLEYIETHGRLSETVDLSRVALDELLKRDKLGKLSLEYRHEIDDVAIANLSPPFTSPVQYDFGNELFQRLSDGKLTVDQQSRMYRNAVTLRLDARPVIALGDNVPLRLRCQNETFSIGYEIKCATLDNHPVILNQQHGINDSIDQDTLCSIKCDSVGVHKLIMSVQLHYYGRGSFDPPELHQELRSISTTFEVSNQTEETLIRLVKQSKLCAVIQRGIDMPAAEWHRSSRTLFVGLRIRPPPVDIGFDVYAKFTGHEWLLGHYARTAAARWDYPDFLQSALPKPPAKIELIFRASRKAAADSLDVYEIWDGQLDLKDVSVTYSQ